MSTVTIHYGATQASLTFPGGTIDLNTLHGTERSKVRNAVVDAFCKSRGLEKPKPPRNRKRSKK